MESLQKIIRVKKQDSVWLHMQLEADDGIATHTTVRSLAGEPFCDVLVFISPSFESRWNLFLSELNIEYKILSQ